MDCHTIHTVRQPVSVRLKSELVAKLKASADAGYRNLSQEVEMRLEDSYRKDAPAVVEHSEARIEPLSEDDHEHSNPEPKP